MNKTRSQPPGVGPSRGVLDSLDEMAFAIALSLVHGRDPESLTGGKTPDRIINGAYNLAQRFQSRMGSASGATPGRAANDADRQVDGHRAD